MDEKTNSLLNELSEAERQEVLKILGEMSDTGSSQSYNEFLRKDYDEIPVDIETFLRDKKYLGNGLVNDDGKFTVFPYWLDMLKKTFPDPLQPAEYHTVALTGAIGLGKSFVAVLIGLYELYRMLCLKDPYLYYGLQPIDKITFAIMNVTIDASKGVAWDKMQQLLLSSPWFLDRGTVSGTVYKEWAPSKRIELIPGSLTSHILGRAVFFAFFDEISFQKNQDVETQKLKARALVSAADARMQSRFMKGEKNPTVLVLASSKRTEQSYMETFIQTKKQNESTTTLVVDEPQWIIREDKNSDKKFKVAVGNKFLTSEVLPLTATEKDEKFYRDRGFNILEVPIGYYENFLDDIDIALTDIAGISTTSSSRYISGPRVATVKDETLQNPFSAEVLEVGNDPNDTHQYYDFFDINKLPQDLLYKPLYIHLDMSITGDKTGIAGTWIVGKKPPVEGQPPSKELFYQPAFVVSIKAPKGFQISFEKNRQFIYWLREQGFNIKGVSFDTYQSADLNQQLMARGFETATISVDRVTDRVCLPYQYLKSTIYEERIKLFEHKLLTEELIGLERNNNNGKIDHTPSGINCFTGDTKIRLLDGRAVSIKDLVNEFESGKRNFVYSFNHTTQKIEPKLITNAWCSGHNASLVKVILDNGEEIRCTPEHKFMLRDGSYCMAKDLKEFDSLMPLYTRRPNKGLKEYRMYYEPMENAWHYEHRQFAKEILDEKHLVHHKDCNPLNNSPDNLVWCSKASHQAIHAEMQTGAQSLEAKEKRSASLKADYERARLKDDYYLRWHPDKTIEEVEQLHKDIEEDKKRREKEFKEHHEHNQKKLAERDAKRQRMCDYFGVNYEDLSEHEARSLSIKYARIEDPTYQERVSKAVSDNHKAGKYKKIQEVISRRRWYTNGIDNIYIDIDDNVPDGFNPGRTRTWKNHKVVSVDFIFDKEDVYDITVEDTHNFALDSGVFVHNSKDSADALCGSVWNASQHADEYDFEFGETIDALLEAADDTERPSDQRQVIVSFEEELKKATQQFRYDTNEVFSNLGIGKPTSNYDMLIYDGIII